MRRDRERIIDILEALDSLRRSLQDCTEAAFFLSDVIYSACAYKLTIVGEAASRISAETKQRNPQIEWRKIAGLRNLLVHEYFGIDLPTVSQPATVEAPQLRDQLASILLGLPE